MNREEHERDRIRPLPENPFYWQYMGRPTLLLGGSVEDNLFQIEGLREHLDLLTSCGGNYVRCTMSSRDPGDVWPFALDEWTGRYDLGRWNDEYWRRFQSLLDLSLERGIVLQIELWDRFDFAREPWLENPFNPRLNINYSAEDSGLAEAIDSHPGRRESAFFRTVPALEDDALVLGYQIRFADELLSRTLGRPNVLYCMDNETNESPEWGRYWARHIRAAAEAAGAGVETTEMWDEHDIRNSMHEATWKDPETYSFVDVSQNNHGDARRHWDNLIWMRQTLRREGRPRPVNSVKIYGANTGPFGNSRDGKERFWRNIFGGLAGTRFHRPPAGLGLSTAAAAHIRSARSLFERFAIYGAEAANESLSRRGWNEAYCLAGTDGSYAVFFPDGGDVLLEASGDLGVRWLDVAASVWSEEAPAAFEGGRVRLATPSEEGYWVALVSALRR